MVHSGGGELRHWIDPSGPRLKVLEHPDRLRPGAARNRGVAATLSPHVAFLADDCVAQPGWIAGRMRRHGEGAAAVGSSLVSHRPASPVALAAHLALYLRRMPAIEPELALAYGASYARRLFALYGPFHEELESGEDTEFHLRLAAGDRPVWAPEVRTVHVGADRVGSFLGAQFRRGRRIAEAWHAIGESRDGDVGARIGRVAVAIDALRRTGFAMRKARQVVEPIHRRAAAFAIPLLAFGNLVYAAGALSARPASHSMMISRHRGSA